MEPVSRRTWRRDLPGNRNSHDLERDRPCRVEDTHLGQGLVVPGDLETTDLANNGHPGWPSSGGDVPGSQDGKNPARQDRLCTEEPAVFSSIQQLRITHALGGRGASLHSLRQPRNRLPRHPVMRRHLETGRPALRSFPWPGIQCLDRRQHAIPPIRWIGPAICRRTGQTNRKNNLANRPKRRFRGQGRSLQKGILDCPHHHP